MTNYRTTTCRSLFPSGKYWAAVRSSMNSNAFAAGTSNCGVTTGGYRANGLPPSGVGFVPALQTILTACRSSFCGNSSGPNLAF